MNQKRTKRNKRNNTVGDRTEKDHLKKTMESQREWSPYPNKHAKVGKQPVRCRITCTRNNTKVVRSWYDERKGKVVNYVKTTGRRGFKNAKRGTLYAAQERGANVAKLYQKEVDGKGVHVFLRGIGVGRITVRKELEKEGWKISSLSDVTKDPHNGCRRKKRRRI